MLFLVENQLSGKPFVATRWTLGRSLRHLAVHMDNDLRKTAGLGLGLLLLGPEGVRSNDWHSSALPQDCVRPSPKQGSGNNES